MIDEKTIKNRMTVLDEDIKKVNEQLAELEKNRVIEPLIEDKSNLTLELERFDIDKNTKN